MSTQANKATRKAVAQLITALEKHEQDLAEMVVDAQDAAEEEGIFSAGFFTGDNDDIPICVPEDADPQLDNARTGVQDALDELRMWQEANGKWDPAEDIEYLKVAKPCEVCEGTGLDKLHKWPDGSYASCETCNGYGNITPEEKS